MKRFDVYEGERFLTYEEVVRTSLEISGKRPNVLGDSIKVIEYYKSKGQRVCCDFNGYLIHSDHLDELKQAGSNFYEVLSKYSRIHVFPAQSLDEFEREISSLGDFRDPANHKAYIIMMYKVSKMYSDKIEIPMEMNGISGDFTTYYPPSVIKAIGAILKKYLPSKEVFFDNQGRLKSEFIGEHQEFYTWLGNFCSSHTILAEVSNFMGECYNAGLMYEGPKSLEAMMPIIEESKSYGEQPQTLG